MNLSLKIRTLSKYKGKTKFDFWGDIQANEVLKLSLELKTLYRSRNGLSAPQVYVLKEESEEGGWWSFNDVCRYLEKIEHEEF